MYQVTLWGEKMHHGQAWETQVLQQIVTFTEKREARAEIIGNGVFPRTFKGCGGIEELLQSSFVLEDHDMRKLADLFDSCFEGFNPERGPANRRKYDELKKISKMLWDEVAAINA
jgi:hypothetical protein